MKNDDRIGGLVWLVLGIGLSLASVKLKMGGFSNPGPGFLPFLSGVILGLFGLFLFLFPDSQKSLAGRVTEDKKTLIARLPTKFSLPLFTLSVLLIYILLLEPLGFLLATFFFLVCLFKFVEPKKWLVPIALSLISVILSYLLFSVWLRSQFPKGILGF